MKFDLGDVEVHKRKRLPHWHAQHAIYCVTFNLLDAIPRHVRAEIREQAEAQLRIIGNATLSEKHAIEQWVHAKLGESLDDSHGSCFMRDERVAQIVADALKHFDGTRYELLAWCVMPNHVHVVLTLQDKLDRVIHSWKSFTSKAANRVLNREGQFWQDDYYDRSIRDSRELRETIEYVLNNPRPGWKFVASYPERIPI
jgi:REP element-mobilizing transposase RayT